MEQTTCGFRISRIILFFTILLTSTAGDVMAQSKPHKISQGRITLSDSLIIKTVPHYVAPYGGGELLTLSNLKLKLSGDKISGSLDYTRGINYEFSLVLYCTMTKQVLFIKMEPDVSLIAFPPDNAMITSYGYQINGGDNRGTIQFSFNSSISGVFGKPGYDIKGMKSKVFAFCIRPKDWRTGETFQAISNVLYMDMQF